MTDQTEVPGNPSDAYVEKQAERRSEAMGIGDRPSKYHQWVPGQGWVFSLSTMCLPVNSLPT